MFFSAWMATLGMVLAMVLAGRSLVHFFQLESYQFPGYFRTLRRNLRRAVLPGFILALCGAVLTFVCHLLWPGMDSSDFSLGGLVYLAGMAACGWGLRRGLKNEKEKKPLVITPRVKRLYGVTAVVYTLLLWGVSVSASPHRSSVGCWIRGRRSVKSRLMTFTKVLRISSSSAL